jgi:hypothetical protein
VGTDERAVALFHELEDMLNRFGNAIAEAERQGRHGRDYIASLKAAQVSLGGAHHRMQRLVHGTW